MPRRQHPRAAAHLEWLLWVVFAASAGYCCLWGIEVHAARRQAQRFGQSDSPAHTVPVVPSPGELSPAPYVMGRLDIPAIHLTVPVISDFDPASLKRGVGHISGTAMPGGLGTLGLAGHRDTFFRPLQHISKNMEIRVSDHTGTYRYIVDSTEIVTPDRVEVLDIRDVPELTLITCYPFDYIGQAPKRFIVHAHLLSLEPDPVPAETTP